MPRFNPSPGRFPPSSHPVYSESLPMKRLFLIAALALTPLALSAQARTTAAAATPADQIIEIKDYMFMTLTVSSGTKVIWINKDEVPHTVVAVDKSFHSAALDTDDTFSHVFTTPGTYDYYCTLHPQMVAKIIVAGPAAATPVTSHRKKPE